ncbi:uncharacterized protein Nmag_1497 [Natrialba magadii ATCC 43099]|uniref:DUF8173 domain-containing protein n=1 Tax=Natrialba magadii (strain ATCC 43099 / DSM 3394 / CCM 3739 / CIP 104546 / IAM 13178 / JCM 8861 / NBRC 102185 / NCIMB 2190 / MS3) TaxID=547559 RepID=D3STQ6_NATMM|nr:hypothetical protein [Natrialba magadii]ADD05073.1 uncharacterized protein Nmag_1497 [Natrialba magadii ATCC 43099]ELY23446.1 hypothetical protein C500_20009 [Natrialba magadii ATCC 43099]
MQPPSSRLAAVAAVAAVAATGTVAATTPVLAQQGPDAAQVGAETIFSSLFPENVRLAIVTLLVGGGLVAFAPDTTRALTGLARKRPGFAFVYGLLSIVLVIAIGYMAALPLIGWASVPLLVLYLVVALCGSALGFLAVGRLVTDSQPVALAIAVVAAASTAFVPTVGPAVAFVVTHVGIGAIAMDLAGIGTPAAPAPREKQTPTESP